MKVWFQNRRTKHKREETETDQQKALSGGHSGGHHLEDQTILEHEESEEEDIDCEWGKHLQLAVILWYSVPIVKMISCANIGTDYVI